MGELSEESRMSWVPRKSPGLWCGEQQISFQGHSQYFLLGLLKLCKTAPHPDPRSGFWPLPLGHLLVCVGPSNNGHQKTHPRSTQEAPSQCSLLVGY